MKTLLPMPFQSLKRKRERSLRDGVKNKSEGQGMPAEFSQQHFWAMALASAASWLCFFQEPGSIIIFLLNKH